MFASRINLNSRHLLARNVLPLIRNAGEIVREAHVIGVPPRVKISAGRNIFNGVILAFSMFSGPAWILYHIPDYQKENRNEYTGK